MRTAVRAATIAFLLSNLAALAETRIPCGQTMDRQLQPRSVLVIDSKPAGLQIVGTDQDVLHVSCTVHDDEVAREISFHFSPSANGGKLSIEGPHSREGNNGVEIKIEIPRRTNLSIRMLAGQVTVDDVKGDKDIELGAGQISIRSIHDGDYRSVDASVSIGDVSARAFGEDKGGFFRTFNTKNPSGEYRLQAHVTTGQIELLGNAEKKGDGAKPD